MKCRHCHTTLQHPFLDLGFSPPSNAYLSFEELDTPEVYYPLKVSVCTHCWLVQTHDFKRADELFRNDYAYYSSTSTSWLKHAEKYCFMMKERLKLDESGFVIEIASNDGYLLKNFIALGIPCLGIEPTEGTANAAEKLGIPVLKEFFGEQMGMRLAKAGKQADLIIGNNVYAHVPDINDFTAGLKAALKPNGTITLEFSHLMRIMENTQFDIVYHEHFSYLSLYTVNQIFESCGLRVFDVEELSTQGGSLRIYGCHMNDPREVTLAVKNMIDEEATMGLRTLPAYRSFQSKTDQLKNDLLAFLLEQKRLGKKVGAYGAAAKGNTLLNYAGIKPDLVHFVCDAAPSKQGKYMPGSHIPILSPVALKEHKPDWVLILPWNIADEVIEQMNSDRDWNMKFFKAMPVLTEIK
jgi:hypothetical protein